MDDPAWINRFSSVVACTSMLSGESATNSIYPRSGKSSVESNGICGIARILFAALAMLTATTPLCYAKSTLIQRISESIGFNKNSVAVEVAELKENGLGLAVRGLDFSPSGMQIAASFHHDLVSVWDWREKRLIKSLEPSKSAIADGGKQALYSPQGDIFVAGHDQGGADAIVNVWNTSGWSLIANIKDATKPGSGAWDLVFTPDGGNLYYIVDRYGDPGELVSYDTSTWKITQKMVFDHFSPQSIAINPQGTLIAMGGELFTKLPNAAATPTNPLGINISYLIRIIDIGRRTVQKEISSRAHESLAWSSDGRRLAGGGEGEMQIIDPISGSKIFSMHDQDTAHVRLLYSPDGRYLVESDCNGGGTGTGVKIWDIEHRTLLQHIHANANSIAISKDSHYLAVGEDNRITIWKFK